MNVNQAQKEKHPRESLFGHNMKQGQSTILSLVGNYSEKSLRKFASMNANASHTKWMQVHTTTARMTNSLRATSSRILTMPDTLNPGDHVYVSLYGRSKLDQVYTIEESGCIAYDNGNRRLLVEGFHCNEKPL